MAPRLSVGPGELLGRLRQAAWIGIERAGLVARGRPPEDGAVEPRLPFPLPDRSDLRAAFAERPEERAALLARAEALCRGKFSLLGYEGVGFGDPIDWYRDPMRNTRAPLRHWSRVPYLDSALVGDHKLVWELNRQQWLVTLALAWRLTGDSRFVATISSAVESWLRENPPGQGINWASSLEVGLRAIAWTWTLHLVGEGDPLPAALRRRMLESLDRHGRHIERHLSLWFSPNTHLTGEALALLYLGCAWPGFVRAEQWRRTGWAILLECLPIHLREDGTYFEQATWYLGYTVDFYLHAMALGEAQGWKLPSAGLDRLRASVSALSRFLRRDGSLALIGDDDGGRLLPLAIDARRNFHDTIAVAAGLFGEPEILAGAEVPAAMLCVLGLERWRELARASTASRSGSGSGALRAGGWYFLHAPGLGELCLDAGPHGALRSGHSHADALAFELVIGERPVIVDAGTFTYVGEERDSFRSTEAHNTLTLAGIGSAEPGSAFRWKHIPTTAVQRWARGEAWDYFEASHDGFERRFPGVRHHRVVLRIRDRGWLVIDRLSGPAPKEEAVIRFHLAAGLTLDPLSATEFACRDPEAGALLILSTAGDGASEAGGGWISECYGSKRQTPLLSRRIPAPQLLGGVATGLFAAGGNQALIRGEADGGEQWIWSTPVDCIRILVRAAGAESVRWGGLSSTARFCAVLEGRTGTGEALTAIVPDPGTVLHEGKPVRCLSPLDPPEVT